MKAIITLTDKPDGDIGIKLSHEDIPANINPKQARADSDAWQFALEILQYVGVSADVSHMKVNADGKTVLDKSISNEGSA